MNKIQIFSFVFSLMSILSFSHCQQEAKTQVPEMKPTDNLHGFKNLEDFGKHLVMITGCHDCHTPKKMGSRGPELDMDLELSGHPSQMPLPELDRQDLEQKGVAATQSLTAWIGPWGVSYAANLTSDVTGIGSWTEEQFFVALKEGKFKGIKNARPLLPPMPWELFQHMSDTEIRAIYAYLKSTKPISNIVPSALPPLTSMKK